MRARPISRRPDDSVRQWAARRLVFWAARSIDASYGAYWDVEQGRRRSERRKNAWDAWSRWVCRVTLPLAKRIDKEAAVDEMVEHGWWG